MTILDDIIDDGVSLVILPHHYKRQWDWVGVWSRFGISLPYLIRFIYALPSEVVTQFTSCLSPYIKPRYEVAGSLSWPIL